MDDISKLLQEAKPLYFARKKRNNRIKTTLLMLVLVIGINFMRIEQKTNYNEYSTLALISMLEQQISIVEEQSTIKDLGLPVDDYGLLMVS